MKEEEKEKYSAFITEVSEILGIGKPGDIIKLCIITDNFFKPYQKRIAELEDINKELFHALSNHDRDVLLTNKKIAELEAQIEKMQETLKSDLITRLKENISYSTSPSCTKGMELFIKSIEKWEIKEK